MNFKSLFVSALVLGSLDAYASPIAGKWQGPCDNRGSTSVAFFYNISGQGTDGVGYITKTKILYQDAVCGVYARKITKSVPYILGKPSDDGVYPIDVTLGSGTTYDIAKVSEDGSVLAFGEVFARDPMQRPTTLSTTKRVFVKVAE